MTKPSFELPEIGSWIWYAKTMEMVGASGVMNYHGDFGQLERHDCEGRRRGPVTQHAGEFGFVVRLQNFQERVFAADTEGNCWWRPTLLDLIADA